MATAFARRVFRVLRADAHGMVDALEDKPLLLKQHLREAELALMEKRARQEVLLRDAARLREEAARCAEAFQPLDADVQCALEAEDETLARFAMRRLLVAEREAQDADACAAAVEAEARDLTATLAVQSDAFDELRRTARERLASWSRPVECGANLVAPDRVSDEEVEIALLRRRSGSEAAR